jgi:hypothetical protein
MHRSSEAIGHIAALLDLFLSAPTIQKLRRCFYLNTTRSS